METSSDQQLTLTFTATKLNDIIECLKMAPVPFNVMQPILADMENQVKLQLEVLAAATNKE